MAGLSFEPASGASNKEANAAFKKVFDAMAAYRADAYLWQQVSEATFDNFMMGQQRNKML